jgi:hypothetical protein
MPRRSGQGRAAAMYLLVGAIALVALLVVVWLPDGDHLSEQ